MVSDRTSSPPALKHGLTSRWIFEAMQAELEELADVLLGSSPHEPEILAAARRAADTILRLKQVRAMKTHALNQAEPSLRTRAHAAEILREMSKNAQDVLKGAGARSGAAMKKAGDEAELAMLTFFRREGKLLQRLDEYERRALSQRAKAIRELDLARIEAERRSLT